MTVTPAEAARDLRKHASAIKAALTAQVNALGKTLAVYQVDEVPSNAKGLYVELHVLRSAGSGPRRGTHSDGANYRIYLRYIAETVSEIEWADWVAGLALNFREIPVPTAAGDQWITEVVPDEDAAYEQPEQVDGGSHYRGSAQWTYYL